MPKFAEYHWADGKSIRLGLTPVESVYTLGKPWTSHTRANIMAYIYRDNGVRKTTYRTDPRQSWQYIDFDSNVSLEDAQAAVETILKLED